MWNDRKELGLQILGYYGYEGYPPGGFLESLLTTWDKADMENKMRLSIAFSELHTMREIFASMDPEKFRGWLDTLEEVH